MSTIAVGEHCEPRPRASLWKKFAIIVGCMALLAWWLPFVFLPACGVSRIYTVSSNGMAPAVSSGDRILVSELAYRFGNPRRGDIAAFSLDGVRESQPGAPQEIWIKRIAGLPGERISIRSGKFFVNDSEAPELSGIRYVNMPGSRHLGADGVEFLIPDGMYFVLGDNSANSADSRLLGCIPRTNFRGRFVARVWHGNSGGRR